MSLIQPFAALRPLPHEAGAVIAPPYDVMDAAEARALVRGRPHSFLHLSRPEVDLPEGTDPYAPAVYAKARENLERLRASGILQRDRAPALYVYRLGLGEQVQTGLVAAASVAAYEHGRIRRHELTRPAKEDDRVRHIAALDAQTGPVFLAYRATAEIDRRTAALAAAPAETDVTAADGVRHQLWPVTDAAAIEALCAAVEQLPRLYIADGHHRAAAAARIAAESGGGGRDRFLAVLFPHDQLRILPYNRVVADLNGLDAEGFLARVAEAYRIEPAAKALAPTTRGEVGLYLDGRWHRLAIDPGRIPAGDPVARLDVSLLHDHLIAPVLGITDPRIDPRIDFVGGIRGLDGLRARIDGGGMRAAFSLPPTRIDDLMAVADAGRMMPPKSTWFEPKLTDGLASHLFD